MVCQAVPAGADDACADAEAACPSSGVESTQKSSGREADIEESASRIQYSGKRRRHSNARSRWRQGACGNSGRLARISHQGIAYRPFQVA